MKIIKFLDARIFSKWPVIILLFLFTFNACDNPEEFPPTGTFTDSRDNHIYRYLTIGTQVWMGENLAYLPGVTHRDTASSVNKCYYVCGYDGESVSEAKATPAYAAVGVMYNWPAATNGDQSTGDTLVGGQGVCPPGWHLPSDQEWSVMEQSLGMSEGETQKDGWRYSGDVGGKLKEAGYAHWAEPNFGATDSSGFSALPDGSHDRITGSCILTQGHGALFWTATAYNATQAWYRSLSYLDAGIGRHRYYYYGGRSVRCVKNQ
jgi:uncharacterized protein (TIGR02145 family)